MCAVNPRPPNAVRLAFSESLLHLRRIVTFQEIVHTLSIILSLVTPLVCINCTVETPLPPPSWPRKPKSDRIRAHRPTAKSKSEDAGGKPGEKKYI